MGSGHESGPPQRLALANRSRPAWRSMMNRSTLITVTGTIQGSQRSLRARRLTGRSHRPEGRGALWMKPRPGARLRHAPTLAHALIYTCEARTVLSDILEVKAAASELVELSDKRGLAPA